MRGGESSKVPRPIGHDLAMRRVFASLASLGLVACQLAPDLVQLADDEPGETQTDASETATSREDTSGDASESESETQTDPSDGEPTTLDPTMSDPTEDPAWPCVGDCPCLEPTCEQSCGSLGPASCVMDCAPGSTCLQTCDSPYGFGSCPPESSCHMLVLSEGCQLGCSGSAQCSMQCAAPTSCAMFCDSTASCTLACPQGGCHIECYGSSCTIDACPAGCTMTCSPESLCTMNCDDPLSCLIEYL